MSEVWLINQYALPADGAGGTRHRALAAAWAAAGHETTIWAAPHHYSTGARSDGNGRASDGPGVAFHWVPSRSHGGNGLIRVLGMLEFSVRVAWRGALSSGKAPDVVIGSSPNLFAALGAYVVARRWRAQYILEVRDIWPSSLIELLGMRRRHPLIIALALIERFLYGRADHIVGLMEGLASHVESVVGPARASVTWIPNGVDLSLYASVAGSPAMREPFRVVYAGAQGPPNSLDTAIDAMALLADQPIELHLYGSGASKNALRERARRMPSVVFHDPVPKTEIPRVLEDASALLICWRDSPLYARGVSANKLFDYLASGRPVVQSYSGAQDVVTAAGAGITVPAENPEALARALMRVARMSADERERMGEAGKSWVRRNRSMHQLAARFAGIFRGRSS